MLAALYAFFSSPVGVIVNGCATLAFLGCTIYYGVNNFTLKTELYRQRAVLAEKVGELNRLQASIREAQIMTAALSDRLKAAEEASAESKKSMRSQIAKLKAAKPTNNADSVRAYLLDGRQD